MQLAEKIRQIIKDRRGVSFPLVIGVTLALVKTFWVHILSMAVI